MCVCVYLFTYLFICVCINGYGIYANFSKAGVWGQSVKQLAPKCTMEGGVTGSSSPRGFSSLTASHPPKDSGTVLGNCHLRMLYMANITTVSPQGGCDSMVTFQWPAVVASRMFPALLRFRWTCHCPVHCDSRFFDAHALEKWATSPEESSTEGSVGAVDKLTLCD